MAFTNKEFRVLAQLHRDILQNFRYQTDKDKYGQVEYWESEALIEQMATKRIPSFTGDCEDVARIFMHRARLLGFPARLVIGWDETNAGHCWCEVANADFTDAVHLDNRQRTVVSTAGLKGYRPDSASPWDPVVGETRPWVDLT